MTTFDIPPQGIDNIEDWYRVRLGRVTASRIGDATRKLVRGGWAKDRENYKHELIAERLTGQARQRYISEAMVWGQQCEGDARLAYQKRMGYAVDNATWFVQHPIIRDAGCSPDGSIGSDGLAQFKCPETSTYVRILTTKEIDPDYIAQCQWEMACTGRKWNDLVFYDPRISDPKFRMFRTRVHRDNEWIAATEIMVMALLKEIEDAIASIGAMEAPHEIEKPQEPEPVTGWSDNLPADNFSGIDGLIKAGLIKKGMP